MNSLRSVSRFLVAATMIFAGNAIAVNKMVSDAIDAKKGQAVAVVIANGLPKGSDAAKTAVETLGYIVDQGDDVDYVNVVVNGTVNYTTRKMMEKGYNLDGASKVLCNDGIGYYLNPIIKETVAASTPQVVAGAAVLVLAQVIARTK